MSFKDKFHSQIGLSGSCHSSGLSEGEKLMRSKHAEGGSPKMMKRCKSERQEHYLGESVVNKVKGAYKGAQDTVGKVKKGINTAKEVYKSGKELYGQAKHGIEEGKKFYKENKEQVHNAISEGKRLYGEHGKPALEKAKETVGMVKKAVGRKAGGRMWADPNTGAGYAKKKGGSVHERMTGADYKKSGPSHKYHEGIERETHSWGDVAGAASFLGAGRNRRAKGGKMEREHHGWGESVGAAAKAALPLAKMAAPALVGWGVTKALNAASERGKKSKKFNGGEVRENRTAKPPKMKERSEHAEGGVGKIRRGQYSWPAGSQ